MYRKTSSWSKVAIATLLTLLSGCASLSPGMYMGEHPTAEPAASDVKAEIKLITPQLLRAEQQLRDQQTGGDITALLALPGPYRIDRGDILSISIVDHPEIAAPMVTSAILPASSEMSSTPGSDKAAQTATMTGFVVNHEGMLQFPFIGEAKVAGLTEMEARALLAKRLTPYLKKPNIMLRVQVYRSKRVYVDGEVKAPGMQMINDIPMTLLEAVNRAGGFLPTSDQSQISINRRGTTYLINLPQIVRKGVNPADIMLANGDVVHVLSRDETKVFVLGEVTHPRTVPMRNGRLSLNEALGEAGGLNPISASGRQVYVVRNAMAEKATVYNLDARSPVALAMAENFELQSKDVVFVDASSLARFNRVISLILPSAVSTISAATSYQAVQK